jgi:hypothetical protein
MRKGEMAVYNKRFLKQDADLFRHWIIGMPGYLFTYMPWHWFTNISWHSGRGVKRLSNRQGKRQSGMNGVDGKLMERWWKDDWRLVYGWLKAGRQIKTSIFDRFMHHKKSKRQKMPFTHWSQLILFWTTCWPGKTHPIEKGVFHRANRSLTSWGWNQTRSAFSGLWPFSWIVLSFRSWFASAFGNRACSFSSYWMVEMSFSSQMILWLCIISIGVQK